MMHSLLLLLLEDSIGDLNKSSLSVLNGDDKELSSFEGEVFAVGLSKIFSLHKGTLTPWSRNQSRNFATLVFGSSMYRYMFTVRNATWIPRNNTPIRNTNVRIFQHPMDFLPYDELLAILVTLIFLSVFYEASLRIVQP